MRAEETVQEGGTVHIRVETDINQIQLIVPGVGPVLVRVVGGRAEYTLPPSVCGGSRIIVSDMQFPNPSSIGIDVVGGSSR
mgnify:CR=1 FL=1